MSAPTPKRRIWTRPEVSTVECRPEVTAYSGGDLGGIWAQPPRATR